MFKAFIQYKAMIEILTSLTIKSLQTNNDKEYLSHAFIQFLKDHSIAHRLTYRYFHPQNGKVERKHRHITKIGLALLATTILPISFWEEAFLIATHLINRLPSFNLN